MTTVLDDVLQAEKSADATIAEAKVVATRAVTEATTAQAAAIKQETENLSKNRAETLATYQTELESLKNSIVAKTEIDVAAVTESFSKNHEKLVTLVTERLR